MPNHDDKKPNLSLVPSLTPKWLAKVRQQTNVAMDKILNGMPGLVDPRESLAATSNRYTDLLATPSQPTTSPTGPTSMTTDLKHTAELVEKHRLTTSIQADNSEETLARLKEVAKAYAEAHGFELMGTTAVWLTPGPNHYEHKVALEFDVVVGKGDISLDQRMPGVLDSWRWSAGRFEWWRKVFNRMDGRQGRILAQREDDARVIRFPGPTAFEGDPGVPPVDQRPPWQRRAEGWDEDDVVETDPTHRQLIDQAEARRLAAFDREDTILHATEASPGYVGVRLSGKRCGDCYAIGGHTSECRWSQ